MAPQGSNQHCWKSAWLCLRGSKVVAQCWWHLNYLKNQIEFPKKKQVKGKETRYQIIF
jgi:hypothetical protein